MNKKITVLLCFSVSLGQYAYGSEVDIPNTFSSGTAAIATEVNDNFSELETAVNDNFDQIESLQSLVTNLQTTIDGLQQNIATLNNELDALNFSSVARIISPRSRNNAFDDYSLNDGKAVFTIQFNVAIDTDSVAIGDNIQISGASGSATATIEWRDDNTTMQLTTLQNFTTISPCFSGGITLEIFGDGANPVMDAQGKAIDGNNNGLPGGDWTDSYDILC